ncbi:MAG TPA: glycosyltransferase family 4 protein [Chitinophagales bacterium]|nr:glycosyltransferase family 4 protein [Chitinophagales bacterium]
MGQPYRIAVLSYNKSKYSETFIQNQVKHLEGEVHYLYGGAPPRFYGNDEPLVRPDVFSFLKQVKANEGAEEKLLAAIENYLVQNRIDVVLANYAITALPVMEICQRRKIPLVVHFHGWTAYRNTVLEQYGQQYPRLFKIATDIIAVSQDMSHQLQKLGAPEKKISVIPCGADEELFTYTHHSKNPPVFLSIGRFCDTKNPHLTLLAFSIAAQKIKGAKLIMAGGDEGLLNTCHTLVKAHGIENRVEFKGVQTHQQVAQLMHRSFALVQHSATTIQGEKEGTPVTVLEAALSGLPVIATKHGGIADIFTDNENALLCAEFDVETMAANMVKLATETMLAERLAQNAAATVKGSYTLNHYIRALNRVISHAISHK